MGGHPQPANPKLVLRLIAGANPFLLVEEMMTEQIAAQGDGDATPPRYLNRKDASAYLRRVFGVSYTPGSLQQFDILGTGPGAFKALSVIIYPLRVSSIPISAFEASCDLFKCDVTLDAYAWRNHSCFLQADRVFILYSSLP
jgi:hypothetical protein